MAQSDEKVGKILNVIAEQQENERRKREAYTNEAVRDVRELFEADKQAIYYVRQLQCKFEKKYFHWVTDRAILKLKDEGFLRREPRSGSTGVSIHFYVHHSNRYPARQINRMIKVVEAYSQDTISRSIGCHAENLFGVALSLKGFQLTGRDTNSYGAKKWEDSNHDLDYILQHNGVAYGCEIKNKLEYIEFEELNIKLKMCRFLGLRPLFIMRYSPKTYNELIRASGGYSMIFETQIYEINQTELVSRMREILQLPVLCSSRIPDSIVDRFLHWHVANPT